MLGLKRIDRYLAAEILVPFVMSLVFLYFLLMVLQMMRGIEILFGAGVGPKDLLLIALYQGPHFLVMAMPISLLFGVVLAVGRLSEDRETLAFIASGVSPLRLLAAPIAISLAVGGAGIFLARGPDPRGLMALQLHANEMIKQNMVGDVKPGVFYSALVGMTLYAKGVSEDRQFTQLMISDERDPDTSMLVLADEGQFDPMGQSGLLRLGMRAGELHHGAAHGEEYTVAGFDHATINIDLARMLYKKNKFSRAREELTPAELGERAELARAEGDEEGARKFEMARARRSADPLAAVAFALCGVPLAMSRRGSTRAIGAIATIGAYVGYYVVARMAEIQGEAGNLPYALAANLANATFLVVAVILMWRATRAE